METTGSDSTPLKEVADLTKGLNQVQPKPRDPRPDLAEDHYKWSAVLALAWESDRIKGRLDDATSLYGLLHGLRCGEARLEVAPRGTRLKMDLEPVAGWQRAELVAMLEPYRAEIANLFERGLRISAAVEQWQAEKERRAG